MKKLFNILVIAGLLLAPASVALADLPGPSWWTAEQIQNVGTSDANVSVSIYDATGAETPCTSTTLSPGGAATWFPWDFDDQGCYDQAEGTAVAGIATADGPIVAIVQELNSNFFGGESGTAVGAYRGFGGGITNYRILFPVWKNNHQNETTTFFVQNAGSSAVDINFSFTEQGGGPNAGENWTHSVSGVAPGAMVAVVPNDAGVPAGEGHYGGLVVEAADGTTPLAGVVNEHETTASGATTGYLKATRAFVPSEASTTVYAPSVKKQYPTGGCAIGGACEVPANKWSSVVVQNAGTETIDVTLNVVIANNDTGRAGQTVTDSVTGASLGPGESAFFLSLFGPLSGDLTEQMQAQEFGAGTITATGPVVATVNEESAMFVNLTNAQKSLYSGMPDSDGKQTVYIPAYKEHWGITGSTTYHAIVVMNTGTGNATFQASVACAATGGGAGGGAACPTTPLVEQYSNVAVGSTGTFMLMSEGFTVSLGGEHVSGTAADYQMTNNAVTISSDQPVVALVNEELTFLGQSGGGTSFGLAPIDSANYEGFPGD